MARKSILSDNGKHGLMVLLAILTIFFVFAAVGMSNGYIPTDLFLGVTAANFGLLTGVSIALLVLVWVI